MDVLFLEKLVLFRRSFLVQLLLDVFDGILVPRRSIQATGFHVFLLFENFHALHDESWHLKFVVPFHLIQLDSEDQSVVGVPGGVEDGFHLIPQSFPFGIRGFFLILMYDHIR